MGLTAFSRHRRIRNKKAALAKVEVPVETPVEDPSLEQEVPPTEEAPAEVLEDVKVDQVEETKKGKKKSKE